MEKRLAYYGIDNNSGEVMLSENAYKMKVMGCWIGKAIGADAVLVVEVVDYRLSAISGSSLHSGWLETRARLYDSAGDDRRRGYRNVPMIGCCDGNDIDRFVFEHPAIIAIASNRFVAALELFYPFIQDLAIDIA